MSHLTYYCANCSRAINPSRGPLCGPCQHMPAPSHAITDEHALVDGDWVTVGGIKRWQPAPPPPIPTVSDDTRKWSVYGPCPTCDAAAGAPCMIPSGIARRAHSPRVTAGPGLRRVCQTLGCGAELTGHYKQRYCPECAAERKKERDREAFARFLARKGEAA